MKSIAFITPGDAEFGFKLAGVKQYLSEEKELTALLKEIIRQHDTDLIVIDERLLTGRNEEMISIIEKKWHGIFLALPSPKKPGAEIEDYAVRLMRRAIGYHVRLRI
jgi:V/A-type H+-transporting ATPase subunit F